MTDRELELVTTDEDEKPILRELEELFSSESAFSKVTHHSLIRIVGASGKTIEMPVSISRVLKQIVEYMLRDKAVGIILYEHMLSTQEAADMLNVSRPFLVKLLKAGKIPFTKVGTHQRVQYSDLLRYKNNMHRERRKMLAEIANISQEAGEY